MRHHRLSTTTKPTRAAHVERVAPADPIEKIQLMRLASAILTKKPEDLAAIGDNNPMLIWEWVEAFRKERLAAEAEARYWAAAMAALSTAKLDAVLSAAE